jgi:hypothetical protein
MSSIVSKCSRTQDIVVSSEWVEKTGLIDTLWDAVADLWRHRTMDDVRYVYFIRRGWTSEVKVGFSRDPAFRLQQLQCGNAFDLHLEHQVPTQRYRTLELWIHEHLHAKGRHLRGEWFDLPAGTDYGAIVDDTLISSGFEVSDDPSVPTDVK